MEEVQLTFLRTLHEVAKDLGTAKISTKAQVTIPVEARKRFKLNIGDLLVFAEEDDRLVIRKA